MTIKSLEIQRMVVQAAKNIAFLQQNDINVFASVPARVKMPYVKLLALNFAPVKEAVDLQRVAVSLFVATEGKNNVLLLNIVEALYNHLPSGLETACQSRWMSMMSSIMSRFLATVPPCLVAANVHCR